MNEFVSVSRYVVSRVRAPVERVSPAPVRWLNDSPPTMRLVVEAVVKDPYVVEERAKV